MTALVLLCLVSSRGAAAPISGTTARPAVAGGFATSGSAANGSAPSGGSRMMAADTVPPPMAKPVVPHDTVPPPPGVRLIRQMHDRYAGKWFKTMTFVQTTVQSAPNGTQRSSTWYETLSLPGTLRIDIGDPRDGNGVLYTPDSVFRVRNGQVVFKAGQTNDLLILTFDVYVTPVERTLAAIKPLGFDLHVMHQEHWNGRPVYVVGADSGNLKAPQFWVDRGRLVLVRQIERQAEDTAHMLDIQFDQFQQKGEAWVGSLVLIQIDGKLVQREVYSDIKVDVPVNPELFDVTKWTTAKHWVPRGGGDTKSPGPAGGGRRI
jgi:hypothetical protein